MPFRFRLETLLAIKRRQQEIQEARLGQVLGRLRNCREAISHLRKRMEAGREQLSRQLSSGMTAAEYVEINQHIMALEARMEEFVKEETRLRMEANRVRHDLRVAHRERELVEKLREKEYREWLAEMRRKEQNEADDLSSVRYARRSQQAR